MRYAWLLVGCLVVGGVSAARAEDKADAQPAPLKALMITGGCCHDYEKQKVILSEGVSQRANVEWTIVHEGGNSTNHKVSIYQNKDWAKGYDVVVHNECFASVDDVDFIHGITAAHREGVPAVMIHCAMHCYRGKTDAWFELCGVTSRNHGRHAPIVMTNLKPEHPIMRAFPAEWKTPQGELYNIAQIGPNTTPLAHGQIDGPEKTNVCVWTNQYGKARVFGTTIGHHNVTMEQEEYLDLIARGVLWACGKLDDKGQPCPGYAGTGVKTAAKNTASPTPADWSQAQAAKLPASEKAIPLFNGKDFSGWKGHTDKYFSIQDGVIVAKNSKENAPKVSTYLLTEKPYRNFRLIFESKLVESEMHSGIALWGKQFDKDGEPNSYQGHLVMFPSGYGFYDLYRRNGIYADKDGAARKAGKQHDWNRMEILAIGNRIRHVVNGKLVADWSDPKPELCQEGPIGLQLHSNSVPQEVHFRGLILTADPEDKLVTVE